MSLDNLVRIGSLKPHSTSAAEMQRLLAAARRNLADAAVDVLSDESRFDIAYKAIMQCAMAGLAAGGYRPSTNIPGHHQTMIQSLSLTLGVPREDWLVLDTLRRKRNVIDYTGDLVDAASVDECLAQAQRLFAHLERWLMTHRPELLDP